MGAVIIGASPQLRIFLHSTHEFDNTIRFLILEAHEVEMDLLLLVAGRP